MVMQQPIDPKIVVFYKEQSEKYDNLTTCGAPIDSGGMCGAKFSDPDDCSLHWEFTHGNGVHKKLDQIIALLEGKK